MNQQIILDFINHVNNHDVKSMCNLMTDDHIFIDAHGNEVIGKETMRHGWTGYFDWFPDYHIEITDVFQNENIIAAFGYAGGTFRGLKTGSNENYWRLPAAWRVITENEKIKLWLVYADTKFLSKL